MNSYKKKYVERFAGFLASNPDAFRRLVKRYETDASGNFLKPQNLRDYIEANYELGNFQLFDHLPDSATSMTYVLEVTTATLELLGEQRLPNADPALNWLSLPFLKNTETAKRMGLSDPTFTKKLKGIGYNKFNEEEMIKLAQIRQEYINEMRPQFVDLDPAFVIDARINKQTQTP